MKVSTAYNYVFFFEKQFNVSFAYKFACENWQYSVYISLLYVVLVLGIQEFMKNRPAFNLRRELFLWNSLQASVTFAGVLRTFPELFYTVKLYGFQSSICDYELLTVIAVFWMFLFGLSKGTDFLDTFFIVLRKRPLTFLHVVHHVLTFIFAWYFAANKFSLLPLIGVVNGTVHIIMYSYFALKSLNFYVPRFISMLITVMQMLQMLFICLLSCYLALRLINGEDCSANCTCCFLCAFATGLYFILFANYFYRTYIMQKTSRLIPVCREVLEKED